MAAKIVPSMIYQYNKSQLMEPDVLPEYLKKDILESNLKAEREAITPGADSWDDDQSDQSNISEDQETAKVQITSDPPPASQQDSNSADLNEQPPQNMKKERPQSQFKIFEHYVDHNYLKLMIVLRSQRLINLQEISGLKQGSISLMGKYNKILVQALDSKSGDEAIQNISNFIDRLNTQKTSIKPFAVARIAQFRRLKASLSKDKVTIFSVKNKEKLQLFVGGEMKPSELRTHLYKINQIQVQSAFLRDFPNKRSYRLIIDQILSTEHMQRALLSFNNVHFCEIEQKNKEKQLRVVIGEFSAKEVTPPEYQSFIMKQLEEYYVLTFCFQAREKYFEKPKCEGVKFIFIKERKFDRSYVYIIALKSDFLKKSAEIAAELQKVGDRIMGIRFFNRLAPYITDFNFDQDKYHLFRFPQSRPYSIVVSARRKEGNVFNWREVYNEILALEQK